MKIDDGNLTDLIKIIENSIEGIWILDHNAQTVYVNPNLAKVFGYSKNEIIGKSLYDFVDDNNKELAKIYFNRRKNGIKEEHYFKFKGKKENLFKARIYTTPIFNKEQFLGTTAFIFEIEELKRDQIYETRGITLSALLDNIMGLAYRCRNEKNWTMEFLSEGCYNLTGYKPEELLFNNELAYGELILEEDREMVWKEIQSAIQKGQSFKISYRIRTKSGKIKWVKEKGRQLLLKNGEQVLEGYISDITRERKMEQHLKESEEKYREAYHKAEFFKDLFTHDMNNILQSLISSIQLRKELVKQESSKKISEEIFENIENQTLRAKKLIQNIKLMSKIENKEDNLYDVEIVEILKALKDYFINTMKDKNIHIDLSSEKQEYHVLANNLVENIFENLLLNSIIHNVNEDIKIDINIKKTSKNGESYIKVDIIDNGIGIKPARREIIFQRNFQTIKSIKSMGLGLSLVRNLIDQFNGVIQIQDRVKGDYSKGTKFVILLLEVN